VRKPFVPLIQRKPLTDRDQTIELPPASSASGLCVLAPAPGLSHLADGSVSHLTAWELLLRCIFHRSAWLTAKSA